MAFDGLPTLAEMDRARAFKPLPKGESRKAAKRRRDRADLVRMDRWRAAIWSRDAGWCRCCHVPVIKWSRRQHPDVAPPPTAGECHHLVGRAFEPLRVDSRNGVLVCHACHEQITHHAIKVTQSLRHMFTVKNHQRLCINAHKDLQFHRTVTRETRG